MIDVDEDETITPIQAAWGFVEGLRQGNCTQTFNFLHNSGQFDEADRQGLNLDLVADSHELPQLRDELKAGFSSGHINSRDRVVYFAFGGDRPGQTFVAALVRPSGSPLQSVFLTLSARDAGEEGRIMAQIANRIKPSAALAAA